MERSELQRLVDNELDSGQRLLLLQQLENEPSQWRTLALALLEEQIFQREIRSFAVEGKALHNDPPSESVAHVSAEQKPSAPYWRLSEWSKLALAASLLVAIGSGIGYGLRSRTTSDEPISIAKVPIDSQNSETVTGDDMLQNSEWPRHIGEIELVSDGTADDPTSVLENRVPLFEVRPDHIQRLFEQQARQIHEWNQSLSRRGLEVKWQPEILESRLPDGRAVVVPVNQWEVHPIGQ